MSSIASSQLIVEQDPDMTCQPGEAHTSRAVIVMALLPLVFGVLCTGGSSQTRLSDVSMRVRAGLKLEPLHRGTHSALADFNPRRNNHPQVSVA